jgi:predicted nucleotidyltransferase
MRKKADIEDIKNRILPILKQHGITKAGLFGSCVRGEMKRGSDVDILVQMPDDVSLLGFVGIKLELEEALETKVDLVEYDTIKPMLRDQILSQQVVII